MARSMVLVLVLLVSSAGAVDTGSTIPTPAVNPPTSAGGVMELSRDRGPLLDDRFGVTLGLQSPWGGGTYNSFDFATFAPTKNLATVDWVESDWYGNWNTSDFTYTTIRGQYPSGAEHYDVEALYFDNDDVNLYIAFVTSTPHLRDWGGGNVGVGIYESRISPGVWIRPGDLSINLGLNPPRVERNGTLWSYDYGVDITHEDRDQLPTYAMRDNDLGASLYRTTNDLGGSDVENPSTSDWFTSGPNHNVEAYWEHTNFDPHSTISQSLGIQYIGETTVAYHEYTFPGGAQENNAATYVVEVTIPRALLGANNPAVGDTVGIRWTMGCRNDGNTNDAVIKLYGVIDHALDFGDAPDPTYPTLLSSDGARHIIDGVTYLGASVDSEADGQPSLAADGDDTDGNDDEDGVTFTSLLMPGVNSTVTVTATVAGILNAWIDFNGDGDWADAGEQIFVDQALSPGANALSFAVPAGAVPGGTYARFRFSTVGGLSYTGEAPDGEVEDYQVSIDQALDFGDAPDPTYPTLLVSDGARHIIDGVTYLGNTVDAEHDGQPDPNALGDDAGPVDDEDGVVFTSLLIPGNFATVTITASVAGILNAWIDFNGDGDWDDPGEQIFVDQVLNPGPNALQFWVPVGSSIGPRIGRFRFSTVGGLGYTGLAPDGEVEDHAVSVDVPIELGSFSATLRGTAVVLSWTTLSENENLGYRLYRATPLDPSPVLITAELIPGAGTSLETHEYSYVDEATTPGTTYIYTLSDVSSTGIEVFHTPLTVSVPALPDVVTLAAPSPHPVVRAAAVRFALPGSGAVRMALYDLSGREQRVLIDEVMPAGWHMVELSTEGRGGLRAGAYVLTLQTAQGTRSRPVVLTD